eukprot:TRINITY_DN19841_c0_g1_i1.p1 TRINITY_DN19841_c0_g1~~TRINITY_DN19841_c0_g1_i1.p1  ORF type:complete len:219 (+),score=38.46 TRINITY_DN19841_c0_g1_i1:676-1332(+)
MRESAPFAAWLGHRTGLVEVCGAPGKEVVVLSTPGGNMSQPGAIAGSPAQDAHFWQSGANFLMWWAWQSEQAFSRPTQERAVKTGGLDPNAAEFCPVQLNTVQSSQVQPNQKSQVQKTAEYSQTRKQPSTAEYSLVQPKADPISLVEYSQTRKLGTMRQKAVRSRQEFEASCIPDKILEEPITLSEDTTSGDEDHGASSDTTSNGGEEPLVLAGAVAA